MLKDLGANEGEDFSTSFSSTKQEESGNFSIATKPYFILPNVQLSYKRNIPSNLQLRCSFDRLEKLFPAYPYKKSKLEILEQTLASLKAAKARERQMEESMKFLNPMLNERYEFFNFTA